MRLQVASRPAVSYCAELPLHRFEVDPRSGPVERGTKDGLKLLCEEAAS